jgi:hypothetical protein
MGLLHPLLPTHGASIWSLPRIFKQSREEEFSEVRWRRSRKNVRGGCAWYTALLPWRLVTSGAREDRSAGKKDAIWAVGAGQGP